MAITRRQFVTRLGTLAAAMGLGQADVAKIAEVFAHASTAAWHQKPSVVWVHGAECTGCSTSLLSFFESATADSVYGSGISTLAALDLMTGGDGDGSSVLNGGEQTGHPYGHRTIQNTAALTGSDFDQKKNATNGAYIANIADVLIDFISLEYHETVNGMAGDLAYQWLKDRITFGGSAPFVMVVEGAVQSKGEGGAWGDTTNVPAGTLTVPSWCSIGINEDADEDHDFGAVVTGLANRADCIGVVSIGQCAAFGGYPACESPVFAADPAMVKTDGTVRQTPARGVYDHLEKFGAAGSKDKVVNVPGCPTNPWWFVLTVVAFLVDFVNKNATPTGGPLGILDTAGAIKGTAVDATRRLKAVYGVPLHNGFCPRYQDHVKGINALKPGDAGCLQLIGCRGISTMSLCGVRGWNGQQPANDASWDYGIRAVNGIRGGNCIQAGHPCMGCTEKGYPDSMVPFVNRF